MHVVSNEAPPTGGKESEVSKTLKKQSMVIDAIAGSISGCIARVVVGPLDVVKIR
jgi:hypothetical protein